MRLSEQRDRMRNLLIDIREKMNDGTDYGDGTVGELPHPQYLVGIIDATLTACATKDGLFEIPEKVDEIFAEMPLADG